MTKQELKWRLSKLPTVEEVLKLLDSKLITQEEAKDILFNKESKEDRDMESLKSEIKFLRELVEKLSNSQNSIVETIRYIEKPYRGYDWYNPYTVWCGSSSGTTNVIGVTTNTDNQSSVSYLNFSGINTF